MKCTNCGSERWTRGTTVEKLTVDGRTYVANLNATVCSKCEEGLVAGDELEKFEVAIAVDLAKTGARSGEAIKFMRKAIGLRATDLAGLLDIAPETLSRWETGDREAPRGDVATIGALVLDHASGSTATADRLRALGDRPKLAKVVELHPHARRQANR
jgi:putative zinc finger/helix-turn-helix YgiT family protein